MLFVKDDDKNSYSKVFLAVSSIMVLAVIILVLTVKEKKLTQSAQQLNESDTGNTAQENEFMGMPKEIRRSFLFILASIFLWFFAYNAVTTAYSRYTEVVWKLEGGGFANSLMVATVAAIISYIPIGIIASRFGRKKTIIGGIILMTGSYSCGAMLGNYSAWVNVIFALTGIGWAAINVNSYPMVVEMCRGADIGKYTGIYYMFSMSSQIITPIVSGALLEHVSYRTLFPYAVFFSAASFCTMLFVKHGDSRPERKVQMLDNYDIED